MITLVHMLMGAAIGSNINNLPLAIILAFLGHYFLDFFPHIEYSIENITKKQWSRAFPEILLVFLDFLLGVALIAYFSKNQPIIYICALVAIIPDGLSVLGVIFTNKIFKLHNKIHQEKIHFLKNKKFSFFKRILSQIIAVFISLLLLKF